ncbi:MAG: tRNA 2-thiouridine(34) synthase MnmA [Neisseriaceae bacterium]|nr:MAG: tRNA 2-thiouridine(34) synthase MnmA [Neisseriaceae bacterium]
MNNVVVGMSGGVDSSVAAYLLQKENYSVKGIFMQNWQEEDNESYCSIKQDSLDAIAVADILGIDINLVNFAQEYQDRVFKYFLQEYQLGRTPNPDILCNSEIKFKVFLDYAFSTGADHIATGHYVRKEVIDDVHYLKKAKDLNKDQSYFLYRLNPDQIRSSIFPLGNLNKSEVRQLASDLTLPIANKKDSTGICFIGERPFREFLQKYLPVQKGLMVTPEGKIMGEHVGLAFYTLGQRKGLGIGGNGDPWYVAGKNIQDNQLIVVQGYNHPFLFSNELVMDDLSFTLGIPPKEGYYQIKVRYRMQDVEAELCYMDKKKIRLVFKEPVWGATPGQSAVIYQDDICLGGGIIASTFRY